MIGCLLSNKCYASFSFSIAECHIISRALLSKHNIYMRDYQVKQELESLYFDFEEYCKEMKVGRKDLSFYWEDGTISIAKVPYEMCDPIVSKLCQIQKRWKDVISNFAGLRKIYPFVWDRYFKNGPKERSESNMQSSSIKRSIGSSNMQSSSNKRSRGSLSSVNNFNGGNGQVMNRLRLLFGKGDDKCLPQRYVEVAETIYAYDHVACVDFLALEDDEAKEHFQNKMGCV